MVHKKMYLRLPPQTIIECLKQATTGEMPPNTRSGQSFIHDPKVRDPSLSATHFNSADVSFFPVPFVWFGSLMGALVQFPATNEPLNAAWRYCTLS